MYIFKSTLLCHHIVSKEQSTFIYSKVITFLILAKHYKLENEVDIHMTAEKNYERYIEQEVEYRREMGLSLESTT